MSDKATIKKLKEINSLIECSGFFACPGHKKRWKQMATCTQCWAKQKLIRLIRNLENNL